MDKLVVLVTTFWSWLWIIQTVLGDYDVSVRLLEYTRDQDCGCDNAFFLDCYECDVFFQICLQPLSPTQGQICQGNNQDYRVEDTHHFLFAGALRGHDTYSWSNVNGQPKFQISVHAFDYDPFGSNDDLGVTSYTYRGNGPPVQTVTTNPGNKNMRIKLTMNVTYSSARSGRPTTSKTNSYRTTTTTPTTTTPTTTTTYTTTTIPYKTTPTIPYKTTTTIPYKTTTTIPYTTTTTPFTPFTTAIYGKRTNTPTKATTPFTTTIYRKTINTHKTTTKPFKTSIYRKTINTPTTTPHTLTKLTTSRVCSETAVGDYDVSVRLLEYNRDQDCACDQSFWGCHECDVYFQICLQPLSPTQGQICHGNNQDDRVDDTHHFLFADALKGHDTYRWRNLGGQPSFQISVHAFDYDSTGRNDDLGVTSYTYRGNRPTVQTVTTNPGNKNMRIKLTMNVTYSSAQSESTTTSKTNSYRTTTTPTTTYTTTTIPYKNYNNHPLQNHKTTTTIPYTTTTTPFTPTIYRKTINTPTTTPHTLPKLTTSRVCSETAVGDYDVSVRLLEYNRDQDCGCDSAFFWGNCSDCDVYFQICLQPLSPTQGQICQGNNQDDRVNDTHHFLFAEALKGHDTYRWRNLGGQPSFQISVHAFDYDSGLFDDNDDLGVTSYTYRGNRPTVQTVTTNPGNKNLRVKLLLNVSCSSNNGELTSSIPPTVHSTLMSTETQNLTRDYTSSMTSTSNCADLHDSCAEFDLVYGICKATPHDSPLLYKQALEECKRTCRFC